MIKYFMLSVVILFTIFICFISYCIRQNNKLVNECESLGRTHFDCVMEVQNSISGRR